MYTKLSDPPRRTGNIPDILHYYYCCNTNNWRTKTTPSSHHVIYHIIPGRYYSRLPNISRHSTAVVVVTLQSDAWRAHGKPKPPVERTAARACVPLLYVQPTRQPHVFWCRNWLFRVLHFVLDSSWGSDVIIIFNAPHLYKVSLILFFFFMAAHHRLKDAPCSETQISRERKLDTAPSPYLRAINHRTRRSADTRVVIYN